MKVRITSGVHAQELELVQLEQIVIAARSYLNARVKERKRNKVNDLSSEERLREKCLDLLLWANEAKRK